MPFVPATTCEVRARAPFVLDRIVTPGPEPRSVMDEWTSRLLLTMNVPGLSMTTWPAGQASSLAWIAAESSPPAGDRVAQIASRPGTPPFDIIPGFHAKFLSEGTIDCPNATGDEKIKVVKIIADAANVCDNVAPALAQLRTAILASTIVITAPLRSSRIGIQVDTRLTRT